MQYSMTLIRVPKAFMGYRLVLGGRDIHMYIHVTQEAVKILFSCASSWKIEDERGLALRYHASIQKLWLLSCNSYVRDRSSS